METPVRRRRASCRALLWLWLSVSPAAAYLTDYDAHPEPPLPPLAAAGQTVVDPTFGSTILRVTDERDGLSCGTEYSYWSNFSKDGTWLMAGCSVGTNTWIDSISYIYRFDPVGFRWVSKKMYRVGNPAPVIPSDGHWSGSEDNVLWVDRGSRIWRFDVSTDSATVLKDFASELPGETLWQMHSSDDDRRFSFTRRLIAGDYHYTGYAVWDRPSDRLIVNVNVPNGYLDEVQIDKTGRYLVVKYDLSAAPPGSKVRNRIIDLDTGIATDLVDGDPDYAMGHSDNGHGVEIGENGWLPGLHKRVLANPRSSVPIFTRFGWQSGAGGHYSLVADDESWLAVSSCLGNDRIFGGEILMVATDGSERVKRIAHHHSPSNNGLDYEKSPRGNISRNGKWIAFTSSWGSATRTDLFVVGVEPRNAAAVSAAPGLAVRVSPNPWRADRTPEAPIRFDRLSSNTKIDIFTASGHRVRTLRTDQPSIDWDRQNAAGKPVASGVYLYIVTDADGHRQRGKLAIVR